MSEHTQAAIETTIVATSQKATVVGGGADRSVMFNVVMAAKRSLFYCLEKGKVYARAIIY